MTDVILTVHDFRQTLANFADLACAVRALLFLMFDQFCLVTEHVQVAVLTAVDGFALAAAAPSDVPAVLLRACVLVTLVEGTNENGF